MSHQREQKYKLSSFQDEMKEIEDKDLENISGGGKGYPHIKGADPTPLLTPKQRKEAEKKSDLPDSQRKPYQPPTEMSVLRGLGLSEEPPGVRFYVKDGMLYKEARRA